MESLHGAGALVALAGAALLGIGGGVAAWLDRWHDIVRRVAAVVAAVFLVVAASGLGTLAGGASPAEGLHLLYGTVLVLVVPAGLVFASEAPARARSGTVGVVGLAALLVAWRLFATG